MTYATWKAASICIMEKKNTTILLKKTFHSRFQWEHVQNISPCCITGDECAAARIPEWVQMCAQSGSLFVQYDQDHGLSRHMSNFLRRLTNVGNMPLSASERSPHRCLPLHRASSSPHVIRKTPDLWELRRRFWQNCCSSCSNSTSRDKVRYPDT